MTRAPSQPGPFDDKLTQAQLDLVLSRVSQLPTLPSIAARLLDRVASAKPAPAAELLALVRLDPPLTARLLRMANCFWPAQVGTAAQAAKLLGEEALKSVILSAQGDILSPFSENNLFSPPFWRHCLATAIAAQRISDRLGLCVQSEQAFACGLLHDLGKLAAQHCLPKAYQRASDAARIAKGDIALYEREILGADHTTIGRRLAAHWKFPLLLQQVIWLHHQPFDSLPASLENRALVAAVGLADALARQQHVGFCGNFLPETNLREQAKQLGLDEAAMDEIAAQLPQETADLAGPLGIEQSVSEAHYHKALMRANHELSQLNAQLQHREELLQGQAQAFELLRDFSSRLTGQATVSDLLEGVARIFGASLGGGAQPAGVVAYSLSPNSQDILCLRLAEEAAWRSVGRAKAFRAEAAPSPGAAGAILETLLADAAELNDWLAPESLHIPLICAGRWIGGAFLPADAPRCDAMPPELRESLAGAMALAMDVIQGRERADLLSEQLAGASRVLANAQEALAEAKTLSAIGEMAAGAAHELNNPLAIISGRAQLMVHKAANDADRKVWQLVVEQSHRISDIITELMEFASPAPPHPEPLAVRELLERAIISFSSSEHPKAAVSKVDIRIGPELSSAWADREQMTQVLVELIGNAATAGKSEPRIHLAAEMDSHKDAVLLSISDESGGMDDQTMSHAFTPFYSAQRAGRRRGMGLPRAKRYVENNNGRIWIRSKLDEGTTVYIELPREPLT